MKSIKFKMDKIVCQDCSSEFKVNKYRVKIPIPRKVPCSHVPDHLCKKKEDAK